jgi:ribosomal protein S16
VSEFVLNFNRAAAWIIIIKTNDIMRTTIAFACVLILVLLFTATVSASDKNIFKRWKEGVEKKGYKVHQKKLDKNELLLKQMKEEADTMSEKKIKVDDIFNWIGKGKQVYDMFKGMDDEEMSDKKIKIDDIFNWVGKGKQVYDIVKGLEDSEELADKKIKIDDIFNWVGKGKQIYDIFKGMEDSEMSEILRLPTCQCVRAPCYCSLNGFEEALSEKKIKVDDVFNWIGKGKQVYDIFKGLEDSEELADKKIKIDDIFNWIGKGKQVYDMFKGMDDAEEESDSLANAGIDAASWARQQAGKGYSQNNRLGPGSFDCSGLVKQAWGQAGKSVPNTTRGYPGSGMQTVSPGSMRAGDILYRPGHVGIYAGNGQVVNAENPRSGVKVRDLGWYQRNMGFNKVYRPN